jgi:hypothetical protein
VPVAKAPAVTSGFCTSVQGVFAIGNLVHPAETADICALDGRAAAQRVSRYLADHRWVPSEPIIVSEPVRWASWTAGGLTLRVDRAVTARVQITVDGQVVATSRRRSLVPNRAHHVPLTDDAAGQVSVAVV